VKILILSTEIH